MREKCSIFIVSLNNTVSANYIKAKIDNGIVSIGYVETRMIRLI